MGNGRNRQRSAESDAPGSGGPLQLIVHGAIHPLDLFGEGLAQFFWRRMAIQGSTQYCQRGFQTVRQIAQGIPVTLQMRTTLANQRIQIDSQRLQLFGIVATEFGTLAGFNVGHFRRDPPQRFQAPAQDQALHRQQYCAGCRQPTP